jgi:hypothetical protein
MKLSKVTFLLRVAQELRIICTVLFDVPLKPLCIFLTEEMIQGLQQLGWRKVDVSFHSSFWPFFAHNNIHVSILLIDLSDDDSIIDEFLTQELLNFR